MTVLKILLENPTMKKNAFLNVNKIPNFFINLDKIEIVELLNLISINVPKSIEIFFPFLNLKSVSIKEVIK